MSMTEENLYKKFHELLARSKRTLLLAHKKPDGDTLGAAGSVLNYLLREGCEVAAFCADPIPEQFSYLPNIERFSHDPAIFQDDYDLVCMFDAGDLKYAGVSDFVNSMPKRPMMVNIDHHATNTKFGDLNLLFVDASSTAEVVHRFYRTNKVFIDSNMATCLLTGILTDTSNFVNPATNATCIRAASDLLICGARATDISNSLMRNKTVPALQLWGTALERLREDKNGIVAVTVIRASDATDLNTDIGDATEGIANFLGATLSMPVIMVLREQNDGMVKGSLRSSTHDVSELAKSVGGGGHKKAAGFTVAGKIVERDGFWQIEGATLDYSLVRPL